MFLPWSRHYSFYTLTIPSLVIGHLVSAAGVATQVLGRLSRDTTLEPQTLYGFYQPSSDNRLIEPGENADAMVAGLCRQCIQCDLADAVARRACLCLTAASRGPRPHHAGTGVTAGPGVLLQRAAGPGCPNCPSHCTRRRLALARRCAYLRPASSAGSAARSPSVEVSTALCLLSDRPNLKTCACPWPVPSAATPRVAGPGSLRGPDSA